MERILAPEQQAKVFKALSDPTRLRIVQLLAGRDEMSGTEIAETMDISMALLCHHWTLLADAGVMRKRKEGQTTYGSLNREALTQCLCSLIPERR